MSGGTVVCDLDGVLYRGDEVIAGSGEALAALEDQGHEILFCTNNSSKTRADTAHKIRRLAGYPAEPEQIVSSAGAAAHLLGGDHRHAFVVGGDGILEALAEVGVDPVADWRQADVVVVGVDFELTYDRLAAGANAVRAGARLVATNHDPTYPVPGGLLPGAGSIVAALEVASGRRAEVAGKPHAPMRRLIAARVHPPVWMVGDRVDTDLEMARREGWAAVLVLSGVTGPGRDVDPRPDLVIDRLADLPALVAQRMA